MTPAPITIAAVIHIDVIRRLRTIPGVGEIVSANIYASIGDITRFRNSYLGRAVA